MVLQERWRPGSVDSNAEFVILCSWFDAHTEHYAVVSLENMLNDNFQLRCATVSQLHIPKKQKTSIKTSGHGTARRYL